MKKLSIDEIFALMFPGEARLEGREIKVELCKECRQKLIDTFIKAHDELQYTAQKIIKKAKK
jgi:hypothetical protein